MKRWLVVGLPVLLLGVAFVGGSRDGFADNKHTGSVPLLGGCIDFNPGNCEDLDGDGYFGALEMETGSDPADGGSSPEYGLLDEQFPPHETCGDGIDNDLDGLKDNADAGCRVSCHTFVAGNACTDQDHDGWLKYFEVLAGSDPREYSSTPEIQGLFALGHACDDGIDNDRDGFVDLADPGCNPIGDCIDFSPDTTCDVPF